MHRKRDTLLFDPYEKIYAAGDKPTSAFLIVTGSVDILTQTDLQVANLKDGEIFGEISLSLDSVRTVLTEITLDPFSDSKAIDFYKLNKKQIALSCSSHNAESFHIKELKSWLKKTNLTKSHLQCGIHNPLDKKSAEKLFLSGKKPYQIHNNCAGKHLAMLSSCLMKKLPINNYLDFDHPHQESIRKVFSR